MRISSVDRSELRKTRSDQTRSYRAAILALLLVCVALVVHEIYGEHGYLALRRERREYESLQQEIRRLQEENQQLGKRIEALKSDPKAIERVARDQMHMARPGERIYTLPEQDKDAKPQNPATAEDSNPDP
jgi:cell division protein FtsB